jgi:membrane protease YdiL (CAAX protease family)
MRQAVLQVLPFAIALPAMMLIARRRGLSAREDLRLVWPSARQAAVWLPVWIAWMAIVEWGEARLGLSAPRHSGLGSAAVLVKVVGMVVLAPATEEIAFRGFVYRLIELSRFGASAAVVGSAAFFAAMHFQYDGLALLQTFLDGVVFGLARRTSRSVLLCTIMHALGNAYAAYQRFG